LFVVQVIVAPDAVIADEVIAENVRGPTRETLAATDEPFNVAVILAAWSETSTPVLAVNVADVALAATVTEDGTVNRVEAVLESATTVLVVVDFDRVTVQIVLALEVRLAAAQRRAEIVTGANSESVAAADEPFNEAVTVTAWSETRAAVLAVNVAEVALADTLTEDGTVNSVEALLESATMVLMVVDFDRVTVQVVLALEAKLPAAHCSEDTVGKVAGVGMVGPVTVNSSMMSSLELYPP